MEKKEFNTLKISSYRWATDMFGRVDRSGHTQEQAKKMKGLFLERDHRPLSSHHKKFIDQYPVSQRKVEYWKKEIAEGLALKDPPQISFLQG